MRDCNSFNHISAAEKSRKLQPPPPKVAHERACVIFRVMIHVVKRSSGAFTQVFLPRGLLFRQHQPSHPKFNFGLAPTAMSPNSPHIVLLGWLGSTSHHMDHFAQLYYYLGCSTVSSYIPSISSALNPGALSSLGKELASELLHNYSKVDIDVD